LPDLALGPNADFLEFLITGGGILGTLPKDEPDENPDGGGGGILGTLPNDKPDENPDDGGRIPGPLPKDEPEMKSKANDWGID
jgi:hypothetical protein